MSENPYRPGVGLQPTYLAGRSTEESRFGRVLDSAPTIPGNVRMTGLRGVGKTVLLQRFHEIAEEHAWSAMSVELEVRHCDDARFGAMVHAQVESVIQRLSTAERIRAKIAAAADAARRLVRVEYEGFEWSLAGDLDSRSRELADVLEGGARRAVELGRNGLVVFFDEAQVLVDEKKPNGSHPLSSLIAAVSTLQKQSVPICLVLCGLPNLTVNLLGARTYSERMFQGFKIDTLSPPAARQAFVEPLRGKIVDAKVDLVERVLDTVEGYPYFIQLWGAELWDAAVISGTHDFTTELLDEIEGQIYGRLDLDFYEPRIESLTPAEQDLLLTSSRCSYPPLLVSELNSRSIKSSENVNVLLGRLVKANVLYRPRKGQYLYTAPGFRDYLIRRLRKDEI
ncbi:AAA family ATPase [Cellulosimicrobium cellulans]|uniref:AAA family ATPase n=1 Tax=Cellulosimicrobium cellulans TaxID=1710 RepID=UPI0036EBCF84